MNKIFCGIFTLTITGILMASCGGGSNPTSPGNVDTRLLGIDFGEKIPSLIAFSRRHETNVGPMNDLYVMFPDGTHERRLTSTDGDENSPAFSPDGLMLAYVSNSIDTGWGNHDVYRMDSIVHLDRLTDNSWEFDCQVVDWGPEHLVISRLNTLIGAPFDFITLAKLSPDGNWTEPVNTGFVASYDPCISRDGQMIAFCARPNSPSEEDPGATGTLQLFILREGETSPVQLTNFGGDPQNPILVRHPAFDFTGSRIVFQTTFWSDDWEIGYMNINSGDNPVIYRLTENPTDDVEPCFNQSGNWVAFASNRNGNFEIYKMSFSDPMIPGQMPSEQAIRLTQTPEDESNPDWSPVYN